MWVTGLVWMGVAAIVLTAHSTGWAMEKAQASARMTPANFLHDRLFGSERVMDAPTSVPGFRGNSVQSLERLNAILLQASLTTLRRQGAGTSPSGQIVAPARQKIGLEMGRIQ